MARIQQETVSKPMRVLWLAAAVAVTVSLPSVSATSSTDHEATKDLDNLNKWLVKKAKNNDDDPKADLDLAMAKLKKDTTPKLGSLWDKLTGKCADLTRPLRMLEQLSKTDGCNDDTLEAIRSVHLASKQVAEDDCKRATKVMSHHAHLVADKCSYHLDVKFSGMQRDVLQSDKWLLLMTRMEPNNKRLWSSQPWQRAAFEWDLSKRNTSYVFNEDDILRTIQELAKNDPKNRYVNRAPHERNGGKDLDLFGSEADLDYLYDLNLVRACKYYNEAMNEFVDTYYALQDYSALDDYYDSKFVSSRSLHTNLGVFRYLVCERILNDASEIKIAIRNQLRMG